jgi:copper resistance protein B
MKHLFLLLVCLSSLAFANEHAHHDHAAMLRAQQAAPDSERDPNAFADDYQLGTMAGHHDALLMSLIADRLESVTDHNGTNLTYDVQAWLGKTYDKLLVRAEGEMNNGNSENARSEVLWSHAIDPYWDSQLGLRHDSGGNRNRDWLAFGVQGLAPYWLYVEATAYLNEQGRTAFRLETEYDLLLTQRLILQPRMEVNIYGRRDAAHGIGEGVANIELGVRLRYEIRRELAPYIGVDWASRFDKTADYERASGNPPASLRLVAGVHFWF